MAYALGIAVVGLFFLVLHYFTELTKIQKTLVTATVLAVVLFAIAFNAYSASQREQMLSVVMKFKQNKTVICDSIDVNNTDYTISIGTYTFIGKKDTPNYGRMISASTCE